jgi:predicted peroxiredoxin
MRIALLVSTDLRWAVQLATMWAGQGDHVTLVLLDGASAAARQGHEDAPAVSDAIRMGVAVLAHVDALRRRAIRADRRLDGVKVVDLDEVADLVTEGSDKVVWL